MAKIEFSELIIGIRGRVGGTVFSKNACGPYAKAFRIPPIAPSSSQSERRNSWAAAIQAFDSLPPAIKEGWSALASVDPEPAYDPFGNRIPHTSKNYFVKAYQRASTFNLTLPYAAPTGVHASRPDPSPRFLVYQIDLPNQLIQIAFNSFPSHPDLLFRIDAAVVTSTTASTNPPYLYAIAAYPTLPASANIYHELQKKLGTPSPGSQYVIKSSYLCPLGLQGLPATQIVKLE